MSRYDLEEALSNFIDSRLEDFSFAHSDHGHDDDNTFEDKVYQYLGENFSVGTGCRVQQAFEQSVRAIMEHFLDSEVSSSEIVRTLLHSILSRARALQPDLVFPVLSECNAALMRLGADLPQTEPIPAPAFPNN